MRSGPICTKDSSVPANDSIATSTEIARPRSSQARLGRPSSPGRVASQLPLRRCLHVLPAPPHAGGTPAVHLVNGANGGARRPASFGRTSCPFGPRASRPPRHSRSARAVQAKDVRFADTFSEAPTDPDVRNSRIRLVETWIRNVASRRTIRGLGNGNRFRSSCIAGHWISPSCERRDSHLRQRPMTSL